MYVSPFFKEWIMELLSARGSWWDQGHVRLDRVWERFTSGFCSKQHFLGVMTCSLDLTRKTYRTHSDQKPAQRLRLKEWLCVCHLTAAVCVYKSMSLFTYLSVSLCGCTPPVYTMSTLRGSSSETLMLIDPSEEVWTQVCCRRPWLWHGCQGILGNRRGLKGQSRKCH